MLRLADKLACAVYHTHELQWSLSLLKLTHAQELAVKGPDRDSLLAAAESKTSTHCSITFQTERHTKCVRLSLS